MRKYNLRKLPTVSERGVIFVHPTTGKEELVPLGKWLKHFEGYRGPITKLEAERFYRVYRKQQKQRNKKRRYARKKRGW